MTISRWFGLASFSILLVAGIVQAQPSQPEKLSAAAQAYLDEMFGKGEPENPGDKRVPQYLAVPAYLSGSKQPEIIVYTLGNNCGTGGCPMMILAPQGKKFRTVSVTFIVQLPVRVLDKATLGWHDLGVQVRNKEGLQGYEAVLPFDGKKYPNNPSGPPAIRPASTQPGKIVISAEMTKALSK